MHNMLMENQFTDEQFANLRPMSSHLLVEVVFNDHIKMKNGQKLFFDTVFHPEKHVPVVGKVIKVPEALYFNEKDLSASMPWKTNMDVRIGDQVFFEYFASLMALGRKADPAQEFPDPKYIEHNGKIYIFLKYDAVFFLKRGEQIMPVNGFLLCEPIKKTTETHFGLYLPKSLQQKESNKFARVFLTGSENERYLEEKYSDVVEIKHDDVILFGQYANQNVEYSLHQQFKFIGKDGSRYIAVQRRWVRAVFPKDFQEAVEKGVLN